MLQSCHRAQPAAVAAARLYLRPSRSSRAPIAAMRKLKLPIPVTIVTGALGVGKTTSICSLLQRKPPAEVWCVIVNEFGAVGIDAVAIQASCADGSAVVKQIAGGCMCCVLSGPLSAAIAQIIRQVKPDRVIIEPSGLGHPGGLIDILQGPHLSTSLQLNAVLCLVDLANFNPAALMANETAAAQVTVADVLVGSKADAAAAGTAEAFLQWAAEDLFPPKQEVLVTQQGNLDTHWLDASRTAAAAQILVKSNSQSSRARQQLLRTAAAAAAAAQQQQQQPVRPQEQQPVTGPVDANVPTTVVAAPAGCALPGLPLRVPGLGLQRGDHSSCGWLFDQQDMFDQGLLLQLLQELQPYTARVKGVFRVAAKQWVMPVQATDPRQQQQHHGASAATQEPRQQQQQQQHDTKAAIQQLAPQQQQQDTIAAIQEPQQQQQDSSTARNEPQQQDVSLASGAPSDKQRQQQYHTSTVMQEPQRQPQQQDVSLVNGAPNSKQLRRQLQPICYRGTSMVEVIIAAGAADSVPGSGGMASDAVSVQALLQSSLIRFLDRGTPSDTSGSSSSSSKGGPVAAPAAASLAESVIDQVDDDAKALHDTWDLLEKALVRCLQQRGTTA